MWFIIGWYPDNWYKVKDDRHNCTVEQLEEALEGHFTTEAIILHQEPSMTEVGMVSRVGRSGILKDGFEALCMIISRYITSECSFKVLSVF